MSKSSGSLSIAERYWGSKSDGMRRFRTTLSAIVIAATLFFLGMRAFYYI
jgi:hypothetical protein